MPKPSHREKILKGGLRLVHERGYAASSVRQIVQAAGVPQGSFTNHFASKEAFGIELLDLYYRDIQRLTASTLLNDALPPLGRLRTWAETGLGTVNQNGRWQGSLLGNFGAESNANMDALQHRLKEIFLEQQRQIAYCLRAAVEVGELAAKTRCDELASFIYSALEGCILLAKAQRSALPAESFKKILFSMLLEPRS